MPTSDSRLYPSASGAPESRPIKGTFVEFNAPKVQRTRVTAAQVNAGFTLLPALPGVKWQLFDVAMIAIGGNAATATSVDIVGTRAGSTVRPIVNGVAGLTRSTLLRAGATNSTLLADGASFTPLDSNTRVQVSKQAAVGDLGTATHVDVFLTYQATK